MTWRDDLARLHRRYYEEGRYQRRTLADEMRDGATRHGGARMIFHSEERPATATVAQMHQRSLALAGALHQLGLRPGDAIAIQVPNWLEGALIFQAAMILGVVIVPVIHIYGPAEVQFILRKSGSRAFVCPKRWRNIDYVDRIERLDRSELDALEHVVVLDDAPPPGCLSWNQLEHEAPPRFVPPDVDADDVCLLIFTSGTTAEPKGVQHTHNTLLAELGRGNAMARQGIHLSAFPAGHIAGVLGLARLYLHGGTSILMDAWDADAAARLIEAHGVTNTSGTPFHLTGLLDAADASGRDLSSLQGYLTGAARRPPPPRAHSSSGRTPPVCPPIVPTARASTPRSRRASPPIRSSGARGPMGSCSTAARFASSTKTARTVAGTSRGRSCAGAPSCSWGTPTTRSTS